MKNKPSIVLGTWSWGTGVVGGDQVFGNHLGEKELRPVFEEAMKNGLNLWDSAVVYGMGASETLLSSFTREYPRNEVLVSTKFTPQIADEKAENPVAEMLEGSLSRFSTNYIDIYWIHNPADVERWTPYLVPLVKNGKIRRVGVSNHNLAQIKRAEEILSAEGVHVSAVQNHYSLLYRSSEKAGILDYCREQAHPLPQGSQRGETYNPMLPQIEDLVNVMRSVGSKQGVSPALVAIAWAIAKGTTPIIGVTKVGQIRDIVRALQVTLSPEDIRMIEYTAENTGVDTRGSWEMPMV